MAAPPPPLPPRPRPIPAPRAGKPQGASVAQKWGPVAVEGSGRTTKPLPPPSPSPSLPPPPSPLPPPPSSPSSSLPPPPTRGGLGYGSPEKLPSVEVEPRKKVERHIGTKLPELIFPKDTVERSRHKVFRYLKPPVVTPDKNEEASCCVDPNPLEKPSKSRANRLNRFKPQMSPVPGSPSPTRRRLNPSGFRGLPLQSQQSAAQSPELPSYPEQTETYPPPRATYPSPPTVHRSPSKSRSSQLRPFPKLTDTDSLELPAYPRPPSALYPRPSEALPRPPSALFPPPSPEFPRPSEIHPPLSKPLRRTPSELPPPPSPGFPRPPSALYPPPSPAYPRPPSMYLPPPAPYSPTPSVAYSPNLPPFPAPALPERQKSLSRQDQTSLRTDAPPLPEKKLQPPAMFVFPQLSLKTRAPAKPLKNVQERRSEPTYPATTNGTPAASPLKQKPPPRGALQQPPPTGVQEDIFQPLDSFVQSENVFELDADIFHKIIPWKKMAMVMFYDPLDKKSELSKKYFKKAAESATELSHHYAAVDCMRDHDFCESLDVTNLPTFRIYAHGAVLGTIRDTSGFNDTAMKQYIETLTSIRDPSNKMGSLARPGQRDFGQSKCTLSQRLGFKK